MFSYFKKSTKDQSEKDLNKESYKGKIFFNDNTIVFNSTVVLRKNISQIYRYGLKQKNIINQKEFLLAGFLFIAGFFALPFSFLLSILGGGAIVYGIYERTRKELSGLVLELNSGRFYNFLNKDKDGIDELFYMIYEALENEKNFEIKFEENHIAYVGDININGDNNIVGDGNKIYSTLKK